MKYLFGITDRKPVFFFHFVRWSCISFGFHIDVASPNIEIHVPFGFVRIGWQGTYKWKKPVSFGVTYPVEGATVPPIGWKPPEAEGRKWK